MIPTQATAARDSNAECRVWHARPVAPPNPTDAGWAALLVGPVRIAARVAHSRVALHIGAVVWDALEGMGR
eukprot:363900-Chlamydomonas_euryale.AAC.10